MPVVECSCGMMMSVSSARPRTCCIRCGGIEFRFIEKTSPADGAPVKFVPRPRSSDHARLPCDLTAVGLVVVQPIADGACI